MEITPLAVEKLREVIDQEGEAGNSLRVVAMPAEQGGLQYMLTMEKESQPDDTILALDGVSLLMDSDSAPFLEEATIDYVEQFGGQVGFRHQQSHVRQRRRLRKRWMWLRQWWWRWMWLRQWWWRRMRLWQRWWMRLWRWTRALKPQLD